jgi:hypothetical protein
MLQGERILEDVNAYAAQKKAFPQALRDKLQIELLPRHQEISEVMFVDDIIDFAEAIITIGDAFTIPPLELYGKELLRHIKMFDVTKTKRLLALFPEIVQVITATKA